MRYEVIRSQRDLQVYVICPEGLIEPLPASVQELGPWERLSGGLVADLRAKYRVGLSRHGYALARQPDGIFSPEVTRRRTRRHCATA
jgi:hypothetical protein